MFVGYQDSVEMLDGIFHGGKPGQRFAFTESSIHEESGAPGLQQGDVAGASGRQDGNAQADRIPPRNRKTNFRIIAERINRVNVGIWHPHFSCGPVQSRTASSRAFPISLAAIWRTAL